MLTKRDSHRSIMRVTGVARTTVVKLAKNSAASVPDAAAPTPKKRQQQLWEVLELDEMWTFVGRRRRKVWLWLRGARQTPRGGLGVGPP